MLIKCQVTSLERYHTPSLLEVNLLWEGKNEKRKEVNNHVEYNNNIHNYSFSVFEYGDLYHITIQDYYDKYDIGAGEYS